MVAIAGAGLPEGATVRGRNLVPLLEGEAGNWDDSLYGEYSTHHQTFTRMRMLCTNRWKLVHYFRNPERDELYDLAGDPGETTNLIRHPGYRGILQRVHRQLIRKMCETGDRLAQCESKDQASETDE